MRDYKAEEDKARYQLELNYKQLRLALNTMRRANYKLKKKQNDDIERFRSALKVISQCANIESAQRIAREVLK